MLFLINIFESVSSAKIFADKKNSKHEKTSSIKLLRRAYKIQKPGINVCFEQTFLLKNIQRHLRKRSVYNDVALLFKMMSHLLNFNPFLNKNNKKRRK